jgi:hypothetical protein
VITPAFYPYTQPPNPLPAVRVLTKAECRALLEASPLPIYAELPSHSVRKETGA